MTRMLAVAAVLSGVVVVQPLFSQAPPPDPPPADTFSGLRARSIGPAVTSGRVMTVAVDPSNKAVFYVGAASSGVWKTMNQGEPSCG